ncbi:hypothetical protein DCAR_0833142 [Daucus carota subsp. sativus]|uniref:F-box associated beta-propeller type 3 domain-containing protein n=1 Tax=Daucus carota subsp. sativus TaxID=79200 RepID=A0A175YQQ6_DAUCS|nr:hypothetical protein DCAR_0833142 [Daucus carota subsp. sativus]
MATCLPEEITFYEILLRRSTLSIKCWIRLTLVCKRWLSLITKPGPINSHLVHSLYLNNTCESPSVVAHYSGRHTFPEIIVLPNNNSVFYKFKDSVVKICVQIFGFDPSFLQVESYRHAAGALHVKLIDSVNGLVCFSHAYAQRVLFIWNPVTNLFTTVYKPSVVSSATILNEDSVFYYDPVKGDVKIMHIELLCWMENTNSIRVHVYSFNAEVWKEIKDDTLPRTQFKIMRTVKRRPGYTYVQFGSSELVAFDFNNEVFKRLPYFPSDSTINWMGSLCKVRLNYPEQVVYALDGSNATWMEKCIVRYSPEADKLRLRLRLSLSNGDMVVEDKYGTPLWSEAEADQRSRPTNLISETSGRYYDITPYTESLLCVKGMQDLNKKMKTRREVCNLRKKITR